MYDSDDVDDRVLVCSSCGWIGHRSQTADDSPNSQPAINCPLCGSDQLRNYVITHDMDDHYVINPAF